MAHWKPEPIRLRKIIIENIKAIDRLELEFPDPRMKRDMDVLVMGSKNGVGKTSVLESCGLLFFLIGLGKDWSQRPFLFSHESLHLSDLLIRSGERRSFVEAHFMLNETPVVIKVSFLRNRGHSIQGDVDQFKLSLRPDRYDKASALVRSCLLSLFGLTANPFVLPPFLYFHSYRKVQEGRTDLSAIVMGMTEQESRWVECEPSLPLNSFKVELLRSMMSKADLLEGMEPAEHQDALEKLNELLVRYAGGRVTKLRPSGDNTIDFRISTKSGESFSFDALSSGQKEIISTLYLIWRHTKDTPGIVLIDEPELHLNHEWHRDFMDQLHNLAPWNQYIIATHSEEVFRSVPREHRVMLQPAAGNKGL